MIDTHTHIYEPDFSDDFFEAVGRARAAGVDRFVFPAIDSTTHERMMRAADSLGGAAHPCIGLHPTCISENWEQEFDFFERHISDGTFCAVGEIGLDGHWSRDYMPQQVEVFEKSMRMAFQNNLPVIIHARDAGEELFAVLERLKRDGVMPRGVFHAFSGSVETYRRIKTYGDFLFGIGGVVTFKNAQVAKTVSLMPVEDMVLETDSPWLAPVPHRGTRNEPAYLPLVAHKISELTGRDFDEVCSVTTSNAEKLFSIK